MLFPGMSADVLIPVALVGVWGFVFILAVILAVRETIEWWHHRHQRGRHHPQSGNHTQHTVEEISSRLRMEKPPPRRKITIVLRTDPPTAPLPPVERSLNDGY